MFFYIVLMLLITTKKLKSNLVVHKLLGELSFPAPLQDAVKVYSWIMLRKKLLYCLKAIY